jgi:YVTN family beta-propeller protein
MAVVETVPVETGLHPHHLGLSPDGSSVLVTATSADLSLGHGGEHGAGHGAAASTTVYLLDAAEGTLRNVIAVDATAHNAAFTPDGSMIVLAMMEHGMVAGYDATAFTEVFSVTGFNMPLEVTPTANGDLLVAESGAGTIATVDLATRMVRNRFDVGAVPVAAWASGGDDYFVSVEEDMRVRHLIATSDELELDAHELDPEGMPGQAILNPDATELWVAVEDRGVVVVFDASTHEKLAEIEAGSSPHGIAFDPNGERAFVTDQGGSEVLVIDAEARTMSSIIRVGAKPNGIVWLAHE